MKLKNLAIITGILLIMFFLFTPAHAIFGLEKMFKGIVSAEVSAVRQDIAGDLNGVKADIKGDANGLKLDIAKLADISLRMDAKLTNTMTGIAGANNTIQKMSAGRDMYATTTNETSLMKYIIKGLVALCSSLIAILGWCLKTLIKREKEKKFFKEMVMLDVNDEAQLKKIKALECEYRKTDVVKKVTGE